MILNFLIKILKAIYSIYAFIVFTIIIIISFFIAQIITILKLKKSSTYFFYLLKTIATIWFYIIGIIPKIYFRNKINFNEQNFIIIPNHSSFLDANILYTCIPKLVKSLGKIEIEKVPFFGFIYKNVVISVDRSSIRNKALSFIKMNDALKEKINILIFPEGTFPDKPQQNLLPFHDGAFALAIANKKPILPVLFLDASKRLSPTFFFSFSPGVCRCVFLPPIDTSTLEKNDVEKLKLHCQLLMQSCLDFCRENNVADVYDFALTLKMN